MLEVRGLTKDFRDLRAVGDLSFTISPGEIVGLLGPNGAGKTTALRCIAGILLPSSGSVIVNGHSLLQHQARAKQGLAFVPEVPSLYELLTVEEHLKFVAMCFDTLDVYNAQRDTLLERFALGAKRNELVATLSKGMRQKLSVACALVHRANVFLFDEPLIGVDPAGVAELRDEFRTQRDAGASVLISTHLLDTAEKLCDRVIILSHGRKLAEGTLDQLRTLSNLSAGDLEDVFLKLTATKIDESPAVSEHP